MEVPDSVSWSAVNTFNVNIGVAMANRNAVIPSTDVRLQYLDASRSLNMDSISVWTVAWCFNTEALELDPFVV